MKVAISYRRNDVKWAATALKTELSTLLNHVYLDVTAIRSGQAFPQHLYDNFSECDVLLVVIGSNWQEERLLDENDWVRTELSLSLRKLEMSNVNVQIIPVLIERESMPNLPKGLPREFNRFEEIQAHHIRYATLQQDIRSLRERIFEGQIHGEINYITARDTKGLIHSYESFTHESQTEGGRTRNAPQQLLRSYAEDTTNLKILQTWTPRLALVEGAIQEALKNDATVKLLYLQPHSESLRSRVEGLGEDLDDVHFIIDGTLRQLKRFWDNARRSGATGTMEIRFYDLMPSLQLHLCDKTGFIGFFLRGINASQSIQLEIMDVFGVDTPVFDLAHRQFDSIWRDRKTRTFDLERYCDDKYPFDNIVDYMSAL